MRARTTVAACTVVGVALLAGAAGLLAVLHNSLVANIDAGAAARAADIAAQAAQGPLPATLAVRGHEDALVQVADASGRVVAASANLEGQQAITGLRPAAGRPVTATLRHAPIGEGGDEFRVVAQSARSPSGPLTIYVASSLGGTNESLTAVRNILLVGMPLLLGVVGATTWIIVGRALSPVEAIRVEVADISVQALQRRVPEPGVADEIGRLARTMNDMLDRLQSSAERQRRFIGDASHELQSPLAAGRTELEVALAHPEGADWPVSAAILLEENERMTRLVQDLLFLARADEGSAAARPMSQVDLGDVVLAEVERARSHGRLPIDISHVSGAEVRGRADDLGRVVRNLLDNAARHARTKVTVTLGQVGSKVELVVADDGPGVPEGDRDRIFERFRRLDETRSRDTGGSGLGLAIAREAVIAHGGHIVVEAGHPGARFVVRLPLSDDSEAAGTAPTLGSGSDKAEDP
jgi:signal transduction histidine kinase